MKKKFIFTLLSFAAMAVSAVMFFPDLIGLETEAILAYVAISVYKPTGNPGVPGNKGDLLTLFDFDDVVKSSLTRDANGILIPQNIVMKPGKYMVQVYGTVNTIAPSFTAEGDPDAVGVVQAIAFSHPGQKREIKEFTQNWLNKNIGVILETCDGSSKEVYGTPCATLQMNPVGNNNDTKKEVMFTFTARTRSNFLPADYEGTITLAAPLAVVDADATSIDVATGSGQYQLTDNTVATVITTLNNAVHGQAYTILGSGGVNPATISAANDFILKDGATWTALEGAQITVKAFKDGGATFKFIEMGRA